MLDAVQDTLTEAMVEDCGGAVLGGVPFTPQPARDNDPRINRPSKVVHLIALVLKQGPPVCPGLMG